jgi:hypothetical protein
LFDVIDHRRRVAERTEAGRYREPTLLTLIQNADD